ncbi:MAG: helix-turn-helix transcriptional regulator [Acetobacter sp.]|jgi:DNA-binding transcriptional regulator YdaS (Cro superfamily)
MTINLPCGTKTIDAMRKVLADAVDLAGGQHAFSRKTGIHQPTIAKMLSGERSISESAINALGYVVQPVCIPMRGQNS